MLSEIDSFLNQVTLETKSFINVQDTDLTKRKVEESRVKTTFLETCFSLVNTMMGSGIIVLPVQFVEMGLINSVVIELALCLLMIKTCSFCWIQNKGENDFQYTIRRVLGKKWHVLYSINNIILFTFCGVIYFIIIVQLFFPAVSVIIEQFMPISTSLQDQFTFSKFSYQWSGIICICICFILLSQRNLSVLMKLNKKGFIIVMFIVLFNIVKGFSNLGQLSKIGTSKYPLVTANFITLTGVFMLSFQLQPICVPYLQKHKDQSKNMLLLIAAHFTTFFIFLFIGVIGFVALIGRTPR